MCTSHAQGSVEHKEKYLGQFNVQRIQ